MTIQLVNKIAINITKQAEIDDLKTEITSQELKVSRESAIVSELSTKKSEFQVYLANATTARDTSLSNLKKVKQLIVNLKEMLRQSTNMVNQASTTYSSVNSAADLVSELVQMMIYSCQYINRLTDQVNKEKASGLLISSELVKVTNQAQQEANTAFALCLTALDSCNTSLVSSGEADDVSKLEKTEAFHLFALVTGHTASTTNYLLKWNTFDASATSFAKAKRRLISILKDNGLIPKYTALNDGFFKKLVKAIKDPTKTYDAIKSAPNQQDQVKIVGDFNATVSKSGLNIEIENPKIDRTKPITLSDLIQEALTSPKLSKLSPASIIDITLAMIAAMISFSAMTSDRKSYEAASQSFFRSISGPISYGEAKTSLYQSLTNAYDTALEHYNFEQDALNRVDQELAEAQASLASAQNDLASLQAGLAAAEAAVSEI